MTYKTTKHIKDFFLNLKNYPFESTGQAWLIWTQLIWSFCQIFARFLSFHV